MSDWQRENGVNGKGEDIPPSFLLEEQLQEESRAEQSSSEHDPGFGGHGTVAAVVQAEGEKHEIPVRLDDVLGKLETVGYKTSFDIVVREMTFGERRTALFCMNGLVKDDLLTEILKRLTYLQPDNVDGDALHSFLDLYVPAAQVSEERDWMKLMDAVLAGATAMFIDGEGKALKIDAKSFPGRGLEEPSLEKVVRGSRDGFVETLMINISLVRRRLRDPKLRYELVQVGERTKTDVCIAYIDDIVDKELLKSIKDKIAMIKVDGLPLADKQLEEATIKRGWSPFPLVRYSERPDTVSSHLLEGSIAIFVDTSPSVMTLPTTYTDLMQHAEENRQAPVIGTYLRWIRFLGIFASLFMLPLWLLFVMHPEFKPPALEFLGPEKTGKIPLVVQFILVEIGIDMLRMASIHTPTSLATAISLVAAILIGDIAVQTGLFINEVILYMAIAAIGMFATPSYELGLANRIVRLVLLIAVAAFNVPGFMIASTIIVVYLACERSLNRPYLWPFIPFDAKALLGLIVRNPLLHNRTRPNILKPQQRDKMPTTK
ncbi:spore germination protein [Paenibacillus soyae]|uniref:Spore germination protein n=1 Tax=Paenibacillus soyae TaxID=2969249 RepID=A0A9X2MMG1_9BACL|nr:spore germination protein [Paenibacillus soyae]MCR2803070.1 spore germination protein [Paenibacillus soyae]